VRQKQTQIKGGNMETEYKVKIVKTSSYCYDYGDNIDLIYPVSADWETVSEKTRAQMIDAIRYANILSSDGSFFILVEYSVDDATKNQVFALASDFLKKQTRDKEKEEARKEQAKRKREETALTRKKKQLEKLQKELGI
jgi:hypothetical protein